MKITKKLREHLVAKYGVKADASEDAVKSVTLEKIGLGELKLDEVATLTKDDPTAEDERLGIIQKALTRLGFSSPESQRMGAPNPGGEIDANKSELDKLAAAAGTGHARVNKHSERMGLDGTKGLAQWDAKSRTGRPGEPMFYWERANESTPPVKRMLDKPSRAEYAKMGAVFKYLSHLHCGTEVITGRPWMRMTEDDKLLVEEALHEDTWVGDVDAGATKKSLRGTKMGDAERNGWMTKAVLEATGDPSGGEQAVPQYFDFEAIRIPLLFGELLPWVEVVPTDRGRAAHSYVIGTPTYVTTVEGSAVTPFTTTAFVTTFDAPFFPATCAFEWGRDFEADSAPNFGEIVMAQLGDQAKLQIDTWIATGDGTSQPQGIFTASGVSVSAQGANTHTTMVYLDLLNLAYGIGKAQRLAFGGDSTRYVMGDNQYKKVMQINTGVTGDTRPIFGMAIKDYRIGDYGCSVNNSIAAGQLAFCNLRGYRLYQRKGLYFDLVTTGRTLALSQTKLLVARMRYGGKLVLTGTNGYVSQMTNADAR